MEFLFACPHHPACNWIGSLHELEDHVTCCTHRPAQCLYCQAVFPFNTLDQHSATCLSAKFESLLKLEESVSMSLQPKEKLYQCLNADKHCPWIGRARDLKNHLCVCELEQYKPTRPKKVREY